MQFRQVIHSMKQKLLRGTRLAAVILAAALLHGCGYRQDAALRKAAETPPSPAASAAPEFSVEYRLGETLLGTETVAYGAPAAAGAALPEGLYLAAWMDENGERIDPAVEPVTQSAVYYALARPVLREDAAFLFPDGSGLLRPESVMTNAECAAAVRSLLPEEAFAAELLSAWDAAPEEALTRAGLYETLNALFDPDAVEPVFAALPETESESATRSEFAYCVCRLLGRDAAADVYFPDVSPAHWAAAEVLAAADAPILTRDALVSMTRDRFVWFGGYLYRVEDDGYFLTDAEYDGLYFDKNGRYTSGNAELDGYVAQTLTEFMTPDASRLDDLKTIYCHVKNDFQYLTRNYYDSGATGWDIDEALTIFRTNKGNCYCYAGAFCALARGLGYNARTYSGSIGVENQPHAWTEISLDGKIYICDPEIEMNYWMLQMYTDNFMMLRENSLGWNYQAVGRQ